MRGEAQLLNPDEGFPFAGFAVDEIAAVISAYILSTQTAWPAPQIATRLGRRDHVERHGQRATLVNVVHPQSSPSELPLHVAVRLQHNIHHWTPPRTIYRRANEQIYSFYSPPNFVTRLIILQRAHFDYLEMKRLKEAKMSEWHAASAKAWHAHSPTALQNPHPQRDGTITFIAENWHTDYSNAWKILVRFNVFKLKAHLKQTDRRIGRICETRPIRTSA